MARTGSCLCGALRYEVEGDIDGVWMCHCSNCRKVSGTTGNTIVIIPRARFRWLAGEDHRGITNHIFYDSRGDWDRDHEGARYFAERSTGPEAKR